MKHRKLIIGLAIIALLFLIAAGTVTDYLTTTPSAGVPAGPPGEGSIYYDSADDCFYALDDSGTWRAFGMEMYEFSPVADPPDTNEGAVFYDSDDDRLKVRTGAAAWEPLNEQTLDETYEEGATITVDAGAITLNNTEVDAQNTITIADSGADGTGQAISIADTKTGAHASMIIDHTSGNASSGGLHIRDNANNAAALAYLLLLESVDATQVVTDGLKLQATTNAMMTDAIDASDAEITNALNVGANTITGTTAIIDFTLFDLEADGDITCAESGGNAAAPDFTTAGYSLLGTTDGGALGDAVNRLEWDGDGVVTMTANARVTVEEWHDVTDLDLAIVGGDGTDPVENEAATTAKYSNWAFTEASSIAYYKWRIPTRCDVSAAINVYIVWSSEDAGGDTCLWRVRHDGGKTVNNDETASAPATALDTPIADDSTDVQYEIAQTAAGVINGGTFTANEIVTFDFYLTDCDDGSVADMEGFLITYTANKL